MQQQPFIPQQGQQGFGQPGVGQSPLGHPPSMPTAGNNPLNGVNPASAAQALGVSPQELAEVQKMLQDPNAMDQFSKAMAGAMGAQGNGAKAQPGALPTNPMASMMPEPAQLAIGAAGGVAIAEGFRRLIGEHGSSQLVNLASRLDSAPGVSKASQFLNANVIERLLGKLKPGSELEHFVKTALHRKTSDEVEQHLLKRTLGNIEAKLTKVAPAQAETILNTHLRSATSLAALSEKLGSAEVSAALGGNAGKIKGLNNFLKREVENLAGYKTQRALVEDLTAKNVGPIGRLFSSMTVHLKRIFGAESMGLGGKGTKEAASKAASGVVEKAGSKGLFGRLLGPMLAGGFIIGQSLQEAKKAEKGEKLKSGMHNLLGTGLGMFVGMEVGKQLLWPTGILGKAMTKMPFLSKTIFGRFSYAGIAAGLLAWFVIPIPFQKAGEKLSHVIFGKPKHEVLEDKKKAGWQVADPEKFAALSAQSVNRSKNGKGLGIFSLPKAEATMDLPPTGLQPADIETSYARQQQSLNEQDVLNTMNARWKDDFHTILPRHLIPPGGGH